jgi:hypothetical protein
MTVATLTRRVERLATALGRRTANRAPLLDRLRQDRSRVLSEAGMTPDPWQRQLLRSSSPGDADTA